MSGGRTTKAGGFVLALSILVGVVTGIVLHQSSIGFLAGLGVGVLLAVLIWIFDR